MNQTIVNFILLALLLLLILTPFAGLAPLLLVLTSLVFSAQSGL